MLTHALTVIIPTHGRATLLARTLDSLAGCRLPGSYRETVVVENGPRAGAEDTVGTIGEANPDLRLRYLHVERANKSHALNETLQTIEPGLAVFFDDDVRLSPDVLTAYDEVAANYEVGRAFFGGPFGVDYEDPPPTWLHPFLPASALGMELDGPRPVHFLGFNWAAFSADVQTLGGFNPDRGPGSASGAIGQEAEMQRRMRGAGYERVDVAGARVWHYVPRERCSPDWTLARTYKAGLQKGYRERAAAGRVRPTWLLEQTARLGLGGVRWLRATASRNTVEQFDARNQLKKHTGSIIGYVSS